MSRKYPNICLFQLKIFTFTYFERFESSNSLFLFEASVDHNRRKIAFLDSNLSKLVKIFNWNKKIFGYFLDIFLNFYLILQFTTELFLLDFNLSCSPLPAVFQILPTCFSPIFPLSLTLPLHSFILSLTHISTLSVCLYSALHYLYLYLSLSLTSLTFFTLHYLFFSFLTSLTFSFSLSLFSTTSPSPSLPL